MQSKLRIFASFLLVFSLSLGIFLSLSSKVSATSPNAGDNGQDTCPETGGGWVKMDHLSGTTYDYTAPAGKLVAEVCYKASTQVIYYDVIPPMSPVTVISTVKNQNNKVQDISHASFRLVDVPQYEECSSTIRVSRGWTEWKINPEDESQEFSKMITYIVDSKDNQKQCADPVIQIETRDRALCE
ncbi:MAG: hypothetical protein WC981_02430 [Candidatus Dojkabacteria bacterium]